MATKAITQKAPNQLMGQRPKNKAVVNVDVDLGGMPINRLSLNRNVLTIITAGGDKKVPADGKLYGVFMAASRNVHRLSWLGTYDPQNPTPPDCFSEDDVHPHAKAPEKQSDVCATCDRNQKGSGENGGRACKYSLPMVFLPVKRDGDNFTIQGVPVLFRVNSVSLFGDTIADGRMGLKNYQAFLKSNSVTLSEVVTEITIDINAEHPSTAVFQHVAWADDGMQDVIANVLTEKGEEVAQMISIEGSAGGEKIDPPPPGDIAGDSPAAADDGEAEAAAAAEAEAAAAAEKEKKAKAAAKRRAAKKKKEEAAAAEAEVIVHDENGDPVTVDSGTGEIIESGDSMELDLDDPTPPATAADLKVEGAGDLDFDV